MGTGRLRILGLWLLVGRRTNDTAGLGWTCRVHCPLISFNTLTEWPLRWLSISAALDASSSTAPAQLLTPARRQRSRRGVGAGAGNTGRRSRTLQSEPESEFLW